MGKFRCFRIPFSREVVGPWSFLTLLLASAGRGRRITVVKTKIGQDPLNINLLSHTGTLEVRPCSIHNVRPYPGMAQLQGAPTPTLHY